MTTSRRDIITSTAAIGLLGASQAVAQSGGSTIVQGIGILSSIPFTGTLMEKSFKAALGASAGLLKTPYQEDLGYETGTLQQALGSLNSRTDIGLIVTAGGSITFWAAADGSSMPFMSMIGGQPGISFPAPSKSSPLKYAVSLQSFKTNRARFIQLKNGLSPTPQDNQICLLANKTSPMYSTETAAAYWPGVIQTVDLNSGSDVNMVFNNAFDDIGSKTPTVRAVVVSQDPLFAANGATLVSRANTWATGAKRIVYPWRGFRHHNPMGYLLHGPNVVFAYTKLAAHAVSYLKDPVNYADYQIEEETIDPT